MFPGSAEDGAEGSESEHTPTSGSIQTTVRLRGGWFRREGFASRGRWLVMFVLTRRGRNEMEEAITAVVPSSLVHFRQGGRCSLTLERGAGGGRHGGSKIKEGCCEEELLPVLYPTARL